MLTTGTVKGQVHVYSELTLSVVMAPGFIHVITQEQLVRGEVNLYTCRESSPCCLLLLPSPFYRLFDSTQRLLFSGAMGHTIEPSDAEEAN